MTHYTQHVESNDSKPTRSRAKILRSLLGLAVLSFRDKDLVAEIIWRGIKGVQENDAKEDIERMSAEIEARTGVGHETG